MILEFNLTAYSAIIQEEFVKALTSSGLKSNGGLENSLEIITEQDSEGIKIIMSFNEYGIFLDQGVRGVRGSKASSSPFGFKPGNRGIFNVPNSVMGLNSRARGAIYWYGIKPYPWVQQFVDGVTATLGPEVGENLFKNITSTELFKNKDVNVKASL